MFQYHIIHIDLILFQEYIQCNNYKHRYYVRRLALRQVQFCSDTRKRKEIEKKPGLFLPIEISEIFDRRHFEFVDAYALHTE